MSAGAVKPSMISAPKQPAQAARPAAPAGTPAR